MGIRIDVFAVDTVAFDEFLQHPLWRPLLDARRTPPGKDAIFSVCSRSTEVGKTRTPRYAVSSDRRLLRLVPGLDPVPLSDDEAVNHPELQESLREWLGRQSSFPLKFLLRDLNDIHGVTFVREVTSGYRTYWVGSLLDTAQKLWHSTEPFHELSGYFARILRGRNCYFPVKPHVQLPTAADFPILPNDDDDEGMGAFNERESLHLLELLDMLMQCDPHFERPPLYPLDDVTDWNDWVRELVRCFFASRDFELPNMRFVSFVG